MAWLLATPPFQEVAHVLDLLLFGVPLLLFSLPGVLRVLLISWCFFFCPE